jgi:hypothetical protein
MKLSYKDRKHTTARHMAALRLVRYRRIIRTIPKSTRLPLAQRWQHYAAVAVAQLGGKRLDLVVWPWQPRPIMVRATPTLGISRARRMLLKAFCEQGARVPRGRLSNPTVLR